jgi:hypothetical protein
MTMSRLAQVPSHTSLLVDMFLDMISHNTQGHRIPPGLNFKNKSGHFLFHDKVAPYLEGFTSLSKLSWRTGCVISNAI